MPIDLNTCQPGQKLRTSHGWIVTYVEKSNRSSFSSFPHTVRYDDGSLGSRTDDGFVYDNPDKRIPEYDHDIVAILPMTHLARFTASVDGETVFLKDDPKGRLVRADDLIANIRRRLEDACDASERDALNGLLADLGVDSI